MADNYDDICGICGEKIDGDVAYYCCVKCHRIQKQKNNNGNNSVITEQKESEVGNESNNAE